jgi:hypothetical protein
MNDGRSFDPGNKGFEKRGGHWGQGPYYQGPEQDAYYQNN